MNLLQAIVHIHIIDLHNSPSQKISWSNICNVTTSMNNLLHSPYVMAKVKNILVAWEGYFGKTTKNYIKGTKYILSYTLYIITYVQHLMTFIYLF